MSGGFVPSKVARKAERRYREQKRQWAERGLGAASPVRKIDPADGITVIGVLHGCHGSGIITAPPSLGAPALGIVPRNTVNQRNRRAEKAAGRRRIVTRPNFAALVEALIKSERLTERESRNRAKVAAAATEILNEWARRWADD